MSEAEIAEEIQTATRKALVGGDRQGRLRDAAPDAGAGGGAVGAARGCSSTPAPFAQLMSAAALALLPIALYHLIFTLCALAQHSLTEVAALRTGALQPGVLGGLTPKLQGCCAGWTSSTCGAWACWAWASPPPRGCARAARCCSRPSSTSCTSASSSSACPRWAGVAEGAGAGRWPMSALISRCVLTATPITLEEARGQGRENVQALQAVLDAAAASRRARAPARRCCPR